MAESIIGLYKTEVIRRRGPWRDPEDVEFATLEWVHWYNTQRLLAPIGNVAPVLCQNSAQLASTKEPCLSKSNSNSSTRTGYAAAANI